MIKQLGIDVALAPNAVTTIDLPATAAGTYSMTCGMGMMSGQLVAGGAGSSAGGATAGSPLLWLLIAVAAGAGAVYLARRKPEAQAKDEDEIH